LAVVIGVEEIAWMTSSAGAFVAVLLVSLIWQKVKKEELNYRKALKYAVALGIVYSVISFLSIGWKYL